MSYKWNKKWWKWGKEENEENEEDDEENENKLKVVYDEKGIENKKKRN